MRDWLYSKRPSENIETKCKSTRKAEHRGKGVERQDERHREEEGTKAMVRTCGREHRTRRRDRKGEQGATKGKREATTAGNLGGNKTESGLVRGHEGRTIEKRRHRGRAQANALSGNEIAWGLETEGCSASEWVS